MKNLTAKLIFLLVIQVLLVGTLLIAGNQTEDYTQQNFLNFSETDFDKILIEEINKTSEEKGDPIQTLTLSLDKQDNSWRLAENNNLPVASTKIKDAIDKLKALKTSWPIATTKSSHERFEVAEDNYQRRLKFYLGDKLVSELYLGTSPGFRKIHARQQGMDEIYSLKLNHFDFSTQANDWLDKSLLASEELSSIKGNDFELIKNSDKWHLVESSTSQEQTLILDETKAEELVNTLATFKVEKIAEIEPTDKTASLTVSKENTLLQYDLFKQDTNYFVSRSDIKSIFKITQSDYEKLTQYGRANLIKMAQHIQKEESDKTLSGYQLSGEKQSGEEDSQSITQSNNS